MAVVQISNATVNEIFPSTKTKTINKLITENSLTRLINRLLDVDGYIITSEFPEGILDQITKNTKDYIKITDTLLDANCEFSIRGYYFNLGSYRNLFSNAAYQDLLSNPTDIETEKSITASIYISNDTEYPELYGQDVYESETVFKGDSTTGTPVVLSDRATMSTVSLNSFRFFLNGVAVDKTVSSITNEHEILDENNLSITWGDIDEVRYVITTSNAALYLSNSTGEFETESEANQNSILIDKQNFTRYDLEILKVVYEENQWIKVIPITSLHRFDTLAISNIDGGVIF